MWSRHEDATGGERAGLVVGGNVLFTYSLDGGATEQTSALALSDGHVVWHALSLATGWRYRRGYGCRHLRHVAYRPPVRAGSEDWQDQVDLAYRDWARPGCREEAHLRHLRRKLVVWPEPIGARIWKINLDTSTVLVASDAIYPAGSGPRSPRQVRTSRMSSVTPETSWRSQTDD